MTSNENQQHTVFVYGSLKRGFGNSGILADSVFIDEGFTQSHNFSMVGLGGFPGVVKGGEASILGELYLVNNRTFQNLDRLESNGSLYQREEINILGFNEHQYTAWMYIFLADGWKTRSTCQVTQFQTELGFFIESWEKSDDFQGRKFQ